MRGPLQGVVAGASVKVGERQARPGQQGWALGAAVVPQMLH